MIQELFGSSSLQLGDTKISTNGAIQQAGTSSSTTAFAPGSSTNSAIMGRSSSNSDTRNLQCPRCNSLNTKFCYYNNYNLTQPRHFCKTCRRYWTKGGALRNVPIGGGCRKNKFVRPSPGFKMKPVFEPGAQTLKPFLRGYGPQSSHIMALLREAATAHCYPSSNPSSVVLPVGVKKTELDFFVGLSPHVWNLNNPVSCVDYSQNQTGGLMNLVSSERVPSSGSQLRSSGYGVQSSVIGNYASGPASPSMVGFWPSTASHGAEHLGYNLNQSSWPDLPTSNATGYPN